MEGPGSSTAYTKIRAILPHEKHNLIYLSVLKISMINRILLALGVVVLGYLLYRLLFPRKGFGEDIERELEEVITSDKYKVKGQYD